MKNENALLDPNSEAPPNSVKCFWAEWCSVKGGRGLPLVSYPIQIIYILTIQAAEKYSAAMYWGGGHSASRGGHFRQILIILEKFFNHLDDWFRSLFMCLKLSNTSKHIFS